MNTFFTNAIEWIKRNWLIFLVSLLAAVILFAPKLFKLTKKRRRIVGIKKFRRFPGARRRRSLPRSVGINKARATGRGYPAAGGGYIPFKYNKDGSVKKAWQVAGTVAAKSRMSRLRKAR